MTDAPSSKTVQDAGAPRPKTPMPPLDARAPRPAVVRVRRGVVAGLVMAGAGLVSGALAWAFVVQPELRARAHDARVAARPAESRGVVRPSEVVTQAPATYAQLDQLPAPRRFGGEGTAPETGDGRPGEDAVDRTATLAHSDPAPRSAALADQARDSGLFFAAAEPARPAAVPATVRPLGAVSDAADSANTLQGPLNPFEVKAGAILPAALLTAIDTARGGPVVATVTENVFDSVSGRHLLIPQGARLLGRHDGESRYGDRRAFVTWSRLILPNGKSLVLSQEPGVDAQGAIGVEGQVDRRLGQLAAATVFVGAITTLGQAARNRDGRGSGGLLGDAGDAAAIQAAQTGGRLMDRELQVRASIRLRPGARVRVLVTRDLALEPYLP